MPSKIRKKFPKYHLVGVRYSIKPSYVVSKPVYVCSEERPPIGKRTTDANLLDNSHDGTLSMQSQRKLRTAIDWLVASAKWKKVAATESTPEFSFKVNFITLTLPCMGHDITPENYYKELLHPFLVYARKYFFLSNYVWKIELQGNGNVHAHLTTDTFIHWKKLRAQWNRQLKKKGLIAIYNEKHKSMSELDYIAAYPPSESVPLEKVKERYAYGVATNWEDPNTTDVHATKNINNMGAYLCKYMVKNMSEVIMVKGLSAMAKPQGRFRIWSCNIELSKLQDLSIDPYEESVYLEHTGLFNDKIRFKPIFGKPDLYGNCKTLAEVYFIKPTDWGKIIKGRLYDKFHQAKQSLQQSFKVPTNEKTFSKN